MKKILAIVLALTLMLSTGIVASAETTGQVANQILGGGTPLSIDPALNSASVGSNYIKLAFVGLMGYQLVDGKAALTPELAESYDISEDGLTYTFTLRKGLKWSDGADLTATQVVDSWKRAAGTELGADYSYMFDIIEGYPDNLNAVADDAAGTVTVKLVNVAPYFLELAAFPTFYPVRTELADKDGAWATDPATYVGCGPFTLTKYAVDDVLAYEKNPNYWNADKVQLAGVNCYLSEDNTAILTAYENGTAQYIQSIDPTQYARLQEQYPGELVFGDLLGTYYVLFNVHKDLSPASKTLTVQEQSKARFALGQMVDRVVLVEEITQGGQVAATGFYPNKLSDGKNEDVRASSDYGTWYTGTDTPSAVNANYTEDQVAACQTLIDLGYGYTGSLEGGDLKFTDMPSVEFSFNNSGANALVIQYVQEVWNTFGITATINTEAWSTLQQKLKAGDGEAARMGWVADFNDCINFLQIFVSNSGNNYPRLGKELGDYTRYTDNTKDAGLGAYWGMNGDQTWADAYDALVKQVQSTADPDARAKLCAEGEQILMATGGVAPLYYYTQPFMLKTTVQDLIQLNTGDVLWTYASLG